MGGSNLDTCVLFHGRTASSTRGPGNHFVAVPETGFGTNATSFSSILSRAATRARNGTLTECLGPGSGGHLMDKIGESIIHVLGLENKEVMISNCHMANLYEDKRMEVSDSWIKLKSDRIILAPCME